MKKKLIAACVVLVFSLLWLYQEHTDRLRTDEILSTAQRLYPSLVEYDFASAQYNAQASTLELYDCIPTSEKSYKEFSKIASVPMSAELGKGVQNFRDIRKLRNGVLFAASVSWDGEWEGIYLTESSDLGDLSAYVHSTIDANTFYLSNVSSLFE